MDWHRTHMPIELIELAWTNNVHLLYLPSHTTHILQTLSLSNILKICSKYLAAHPGRVITSDELAFLVAEAWPQYLTLLNIMSGFKKTGIYRININPVK